MPATFCEAQRPFSSHFLSQSPAKSRSEFGATLMLADSLVKCAGFMLGCHAFAEHCYLHVMSHKHNSGRRHLKFETFKTVAGKRNLPSCGRSGSLATHSLPIIQPCISPNLATCQFAPLPCCVPKSCTKCCLPSIFGKVSHISGPW